MTSEAKGYLIALIVCLAASSAPLSQLYEAYTKDFYWTHTEMKLPLEAGKGYFEIYVRNELIQKSLEKNLVGIKEGDQIRPLTTADFSIRLNKKCEFTTMPLAFSAAALTASLVFLVLFVRSMLRKRQVRQSTRAR